MNVIFDSTALASSLAGETIATPNELLWSRNESMGTLLPVSRNSNGMGLWVMKHFFPFGPAFLVILYGSVVLLPLLAWASLQDPKLVGMSYWCAVLAKLFSPQVAWAVLTGLGAVVLGLVVILRALLLTGTDEHERKEVRPVFWVALGVGLVAMFGLLIVVNYFGLQAGEIKVLSRWINR
jgi:hypothetical protein